MDVIDAIRKRRSIRKYSPRDVEEEKLTLVLEAARLSPSARNLQDWKFIVVKDAKTIKKLAVACSNQSFVAEAPVFIAACGTNTDSLMKCGQPRYTVDLSIAMSYILLEAHEQGLGTCWLGSFDEKKVKELLAVPEDVRIVAVTPLGYPEVSPAPTARKPLADIVCLERYS
jgi:nitroreductase